MTELGKYLIAECIRTKSKTLDLGMCGLTEWPPEVCEMNWLEELNFCNYEHIQFSPFEYSGFDQFTLRQRNERYGNQYLLIRNHIKSLPNKNELKGLLRLKSLKLGGGISPIFGIGGEHWDLMKIDALAVLTQLIALRLSFTRITDISAIRGMSNLVHLELENVSVKDLGPIRELRNLGLLSLQNTEIFDLAPLGTHHNLEELNLNNTRISDLHGLREFEHLQSLKLAHNKIKELERLQGLSLKWLNLWNTEIHDLKFIRKFSKLEWLNISKTDVRNFGPIRYMNKLKGLNLAYTNISDDQILLELEELQYLNISGTHAEVHRYGWMRTLVNLRTLKNLNLTNTHVEDIFGIGYLEDLEVLSLAKTEIQNISGISELHNLKALDLSDTRVSDISQLGGLAKLEVLNISSTDVQDLTVLSALEKLRDLDLGETDAQDLSSISSMSFLHSLRVGGMYVDDIEAFLGMKELRSLKLENTMLTNIGALAKLSKLELLSLKNSNHVTDISDLSKLTWLKYLDLQGTQVQDISVLSKLSRLQGLRLINAPISDITPLSGLLALQSLHLSNTKVSDIGPLERLLRMPFMSPSFSPGGSGIFLNGAPVEVPPFEVIEQGLDAVLNFFQTQRDTDAQLIPNREVKLVILGNSTAGKSTLLEYLKHNKKERNEAIFSKIFTTHGIRQLDWQPNYVFKRDEEEIDNIRISVLDFGGQEYYHDCHHLFFTDNTAYVVLWEPRTNENTVQPTLQKYKDAGEVEKDVAHYSLEYWLDAIAHFIARQSDLNELPGHLAEFMAHRSVNRVTDFDAAQRYDKNDEWNEKDLRKEIVEKVTALVTRHGLHYGRLCETLRPYVVFSNSTQHSHHEMFESLQGFFFHKVGVLVVQNKLADYPRSFLNQKELVNRFPFIIDFAHVDIRMGVAMEYFENQQLYELIDNIPILGEMILDFYHDVDQLLDEQNELYIDFDKFNTLFNQVVKERVKKKMTAAEKKASLKEWAKNYLVYRFKTGKLLWYPENEQLKTKVIIKPYEMINRFYAILNPELEEGGGYFTSEKACQMVHNTFHSGKKRIDNSIKEETELLLNLMRHFNIVFEIPRDKPLLVAPQYLPKKLHKSISFFHELFAKGTYRYRYQGFYHKSVVLNFFCEYGKYAETLFDDAVVGNDYMLWCDGLIIKKTIEGSTQVVMVEFNQLNHFTVVKPKDGDLNGPLVQEVIQSFQRIHQGRMVRKEVSLDGKLFIDLAELNRLAKADVPIIEHGGKAHRVADYRVFLDKEYQEKYPRMKVFISYSKSDHKLVEELRAHLKPLVRQGIIEPWYDRDISAGAEWDKEIKKNLEESKIILMMISSDFINTDYIWNEELPTAVKQHESGHSIVIPVVLRSCIWEGTPLGKLNSPEKGKAITLSSDRDEAWTKVAKAIMKVAQPDK